jgi:hypothetical protein
MPRRKKTVEPEPEPEEFTLTGENESETPEPKSPRRTLNIPLTESGAADWEHMREATQAKFRKILAEAPRPIDPIEISSAEVGMLYDGLGALESWIAAKFFQVDARLASLAFRYSDDEKAILAEPTARVLKKYGGAAIAYKDEMTLIMILYALHARKAQWIAEEAERLAKVQMEREHEERAYRPNGAPTVEVMSGAD